MVSLNHISIFSDVFGDSRDSSGLFIVDRFVELSERVLDFWVKTAVHSSKVWIRGSSLGGRA